MYVVVVMRNSGDLVSPKTLSSVKSCRFVVALLEVSHVVLAMIIQGECHSIEGL